MSWTQITPSAEALAALDPYLEWAGQTNFAYYFGARSQRRLPIPVIIELDKISAGQFARGDWKPPADWQDWLWVPSLYAHPPAGLRNAKYCTANVQPKFFKQLANPDGTLSKVVKRVSLSLPTPATQPAVQAAPIAPQGTPKPGLVVTGVIDDGLAFANERFRNGQQTRVEFLWNMDGLLPTPPDLPYGSELDKAAIDAAMNAALHGALVDEEQVYRATQHIDFTVSGHKPVAQRGAHGTHVLDLACGADPQNPPADRPIIGVQLPVATTWDTSGALLAAPVLEGLRYILNRADQIAVRLKCGPLPVVVNLSYGFNAGPHDGSSLLEGAIDELITLRRLAAPMSVVLPAGNSYLRRSHAQFKLARNKEQRPPLTWRIQPDDKTPSFIELWLPELPKGVAKVEVRVNPPTGPQSPWIKEGEVYEWRPQNDVLCKVIYFNGVAAGRKRNMVFIAVAPTATLHPTAELAPPGSWQIRVKNVGPEATFDAWIQRDDTPYGYPIRGRQSRFDDIRYLYRDDAGRAVRVDNASYIKRANTINAMATGREPVVVAGFNRKEWTMAEYSAAGPMPPTGIAPHIAAVSDDSIVRHGLLTTGTRSNSVVAMDGTSVAAPQITRWIAADMSASNAGDRARVATILTNAPGGAPPLTPPQGVKRFESPAVVPRRRPSEP